MHFSQSSQPLWETTLRTLLVDYYYVLQMKFEQLESNQRSDVGGQLTRQPSVQISMIPSEPRMIPLMNMLTGRGSGCLRIVGKGEQDVLTLAVIHQ